MKMDDMENTVTMPADLTKVADSTREVTTEFPSLIQDEPQKPKRKKRSWFRRHTEKEKMPSVSDPVDALKPEEDLIDGEAAPNMEDTCEIYTDSPTKPIPSINASSEEEIEEDDEQMLLEGFEQEEKKVPEISSGEERLRKVRREKIEDFSQKRELHIQEEQAEDTDAPRGEVVYPETPLTTEETVPVVEETETPDTIVRRLNTALRNSAAVVFLSVVLEGILMLLTLFSFFSPSLTFSPSTFVIIHLCLFVTLAAVNFPVIKGGFADLFSGNASPVTGVSLATVMTVVNTVLQLLNTTGVGEGTIPILTAITGLSIVLTLLAKRSELIRQHRNIGFVLSEDREKTVYKRIEDPMLAEEIGRPALALGEPRVAFYRQTKRVDSYLKTATDSQLACEFTKWYFPVMYGVSLVVSLVYFALNGLNSWLMTITLFTALTAIITPSVHLFALQLSMATAARKAEKLGTVLAGYQAVDTYGAVHALAIDATDLFPDHSVLLHGIKTFSGTRIDDAILDAASVSVRAGGPLSHVFRRMIQNKVDMLRDVDTLVYEQDMGLSGWVSGRRVLIGNRKLLDNHGIDIPSKDYEDRYAKNGRQLVYLSIAGELSAMFVVSYVADPAIKERLAALTKHRVTLLVRTCDQNITEPMIASIFDLDSFYVELLNAPAGRSYEGLVDGVSEGETASVISDGRKTGLIFALSLCNRLKNLTRVYTVLQTVFTSICLLAIGLLALTQGLFYPALYLLEAVVGILCIFSAVSYLFVKTNY